MPEERIIYVHRDSHGRWWMEERDIEKLAPNLAVDSTVSVKVTIGEAVKDNGVVPDCLKY